MVILSKTNWDSNDRFSSLSHSHDFRLSACCPAFQKWPCVRFSFFVDIFRFRFSLWPTRSSLSYSLGLANANQILDPEDDPDEEEEDGGAQDIDATRQAKSAVMKTSTRQVWIMFATGRRHLWFC